jgi:hypothetical protein
MTMKQKVYIETTIASYLAARLSNNIIVAGRQVLTLEWWEHRRNAFAHRRNSWRINHV